MSGDFTEDIRKRPRRLCEEGKRATLRQTWLESCGFGSHNPPTRESFELAKFPPTALSVVISQWWSYVREMLITLLYVCGKGTYLYHWIREPVVRPKFFNVTLYRIDPSPRIRIIVTVRRILMRDVGSKFSKKLCLEKLFLKTFKKFHN